MRRLPRSARSSQHSLMVDNLMIKKTVNYISKVLFICLTVALSADELSATTPLRPDSTLAQIRMTPPSLSPLLSCYKSPSDPIDTLDTANEYIKVILFADNTWEYYKSPEYQSVSGVFDECWTDTGSDPYGIPQAELPDQWSIWCVDSLDQYHCPYHKDQFQRYNFHLVHMQQF